MNLPQGISGLDRVTFVARDELLNRALEEGRGRCLVDVELGATKRARKASFAGSFFAPSKCPESPRVTR